MSFKFKFDEMRRNDPTSPVGKEGNEMSGNEFYPADGYARNICFIPSPDYMLFLGYSHLISCEFIKDVQQIKLSFTSYTVTLHGLRLDVLFIQLMNHLPKSIIATEARYNTLGNQNTSIVNLISITDLNKEGSVS